MVMFLAKEKLTLIETKSVIQRRFLVFFSLVPNVERHAPSLQLLYLIPPSFGVGSKRLRTIPASKVKHEVEGGLSMLQDLSQTGIINDGESHKSSKSSLVHSLPLLHARWPPHMERCGSSALSTHPDPTSLRKEA